MRYWVPVIGPYVYSELEEEEKTFLNDKNWCISGSVSPIHMIQGMGDLMMICEVPNGHTITKVIFHFLPS